MNDPDAQFENMYCPACEKLQPKAVECVHCGVIIEKALHPTYIPETETPAVKKEGTSFRTLLLFLLFGVSALYYLFGGNS